MDVLLAVLACLIPLVLLALVEHKRRRFYDQHDKHE